ncbi:unnamed protein product [Closterium sp. NIES-53]
MASSWSSSLWSSSAASSASSQPSDEVILRLLRLVTTSSDLKSCSLVSRRWLRLHGQIKSSLKLYDWSMLESGRLAERFPNLTELDLSPAWCNSSDPEVFGSAAVYMTRGSCTMRLDPDVVNPFEPDHRLEEQSPSPDSFDRGLRELVQSYPNLQRLCLVDVFRAKKGSYNADKDASGLENFHQSEPDECAAAVGWAGGVRQEVGAGGQQNGQEEEEEEGKDEEGGEEEEEGKAEGEEGGAGEGEEGGEGGEGAEGEEQEEEGEGEGGDEEESEGADALIHCDLRSRPFFLALLAVCANSTALHLRNCCGLDDASLAGISVATNRRIGRLAIEGCPLITMTSLEAVVLALPGLRQLAVGDCGGVRDEEMGGEFADRIFTLKELKWQPSGGRLAGTGLFEKGRWLVQGG